MTSEPDRGALDRAEWERLWQEHWTLDANADDEQEFLAEDRTPEIEKARLGRIMLIAATGMACQIATTKTPKPTS